MNDPIKISVDHKARREYLIRKINENHKCAEVIHMIMDAINCVGDESFYTILPDEGPVVIVDNRLKTRQVLEINRKKTGKAQPDVAGEA